MLIHYRARDDSDGVAWIIFAIVCFVIAAVSFSIAYACAHIWLIATLLLRLCEGKWIRAGWWALLLALLIHIDIQVWS